MNQKREMTLEILEMMKEGRTNTYIRNATKASVGTIAGIRFRLNNPEKSKYVPRPKPLPVPPPPRPQKLEAPKPEPVKLPPEPKDEKPSNGPRNLPLWKLASNHCRWLDGDLYCAADVVLGKQYCHEHSLRMYRDYAARHGRVVA